MYIYVLGLLLLQLLLVSALRPRFVSLTCAHGLGWSEERSSLTQCTCRSRLQQVVIIQVWVPSSPLWCLQHLLGYGLVQALLERQVIIFGFHWIIACVQLCRIDLVFVLCDLGRSRGLLHLFEWLRLWVREVRDGVFYPASWGASSARWILVQGAGWHLRDHGINSGSRPFPIRLHLLGVILDPFHGFRI